MQPVVISSEYTIGFLLIAVSVIALFFMTSYKGDSALRVDSKSGENNEVIDDSPLLFYETYTNAEIGEDFLKMCKSANAGGDSILINIYTAGYASSPYVYHTQGDTTVVNNIIKKYGKNYLPEDLKLMWVLNTEYEFATNSDNETVMKPVEIYYLLALKGEPGMTGKNIASAELKSDPNYGSYVIVNFNDEGTKQMTAMKTKNMGRAIAVVYKDIVLSYPTIERPDNDSAFLIASRRMTNELAKDLVEELNKKRE